MAENNQTSQNQTPQEPNLQQELEQARQKIQELTEASKRALADLANYKKRVEEERASFIQFANLNFILEILPVLDNLDRALAHAPTELKDSEWIKGLSQIQQQLITVLKKHGITEMPSPIGQSIDPHRHEAVLQAPGAKDIILEVLDKGYMLGDKIIRPAKVKVGDGNLNPTLA